MAAKKRATREIAANELEKTLVVNGENYNINAVHSDTADKTTNALTINSKAVDGTDRASITFDGSAATSISIVPADIGGKFESTIAVPTIDDKTTFAPESVLNFTDLSHVVGQLTGTSWFTWNGTELITSTSADNQALRIGIVVGLDKDVAAFGKDNALNDYLPLYLYISSDLGKIYFGNADSAEVIWLNKDVESAAKAYALAIARNMQVNLASTNSVLFDGLSDATGIGVSGVLNPANGGTGKTSLATVEVGYANNIRYNNSATTITGAQISEALNNTSSNTTEINNIKNSINTINNNITTITNGYQKKITISSSAPSGGSNGDIWIKY